MRIIKVCKRINRKFLQVPYAAELRCDRGKLAWWGIGPVGKNTVTVGPFDYEDDALDEGLDLALAELAREEV